MEEKVNESDFSRLMRRIRILGEYLEQLLQGMKPSSKEDASFGGGYSNAFTGFGSSAFRVDVSVHVGWSLNGDRETFIAVTTVFTTDGKLLLQVDRKRDSLEKTVSWLRTCNYI